MLSIRTVGKKELREWQRAMGQVSAVSDQIRAKCFDLAARTERLEAAGRFTEATALGVQGMAELATARAGLSAMLEAAAVGFLGERRRADETLEAYLVRIGKTAQSMPLLVDMQRRNGLEWIP